MTFSLPSTGAYLKLLTTARTHLSDTPAEATESAPQGSDLGSAAREMGWQCWVWMLRVSGRGREGEWSGVLPGKTRKWREFWGVRFEWVVERVCGGGTGGGF